MKKKHIIGLFIFILISSLIYPYHNYFLKILNATLPINDTNITDITSTAKHTDGFAFASENPAKGTDTNGSNGNDAGNGNNNINDNDSNNNNGSNVDNDDSRIVRVGWYNSDHFQEGSSEDERKSGYSYEYLQGISNYTGWEYEYVYGGWSDLYDAFLKGDIDLLAGVSYTEERAPLMNYPGFEMGFESYYIYKKSGNEEISGSDLETLKGRKVGTLKNNLMTNFFEDWLEESGISCEEVIFDDFQSRDEAFENGEIDAIIAVNNNVPSNSGYSPVVKVGQSSYFLAVTKGRTDLLDALNSTLSSINESNPYFTDSLQIKYFKNTAVNAALSQEENIWVNEHKSIRAGYLEDYMPFCGLNESGENSGVITDILKDWEEQLGLKDALKIEYVPYTLYTDLIDALKSGEIDIAFPVNDNIWISERKGIVQSNDLIQSSVYMVYQGEYSEEKKDIIAVSDRSAFQKDFVATYYPDSKIYIADTARDCLNAVKQGKASCTFFSIGRSEKYLDLSEYENLSRVSLGENVNYCIGVKKGNNVIYSLIERGVSLIDKSTMTNALYKYSDNNFDYTISDFMRDNLTLVLAIVLVIIGLIIVIAVVLAISLKRTKEQKLKEEKMLEITKKQNEELEIARDHLQEVAELAEQASKAKTSFLFNMSHDIRTPMNAILGFAELADRHQDEPEKIRDYLKKIKDSGDILLSILNNVLEMSRIEKGRIVIEEQPCSLDSFNGSLFSMFQDQMSKKGIHFTNSIDIKHHYVYCDLTKMREIFLNIISNAFKYTDSGGEVKMLLEEVYELPKEISEKSAEGLPKGLSEDSEKLSEGLPEDSEKAEAGIKNHIAKTSELAIFRTTISDTGKGMSEEFLPRIFDEFSREKNSEKNTIEGTGLGMAIVKRLVELMNGSIEVQSRLGEGSTFIVTIPHRIATEEEVREASRSIKLSKRPRKGKIQRAQNTIEGQKEELTEDLKEDLKNSQREDLKVGKKEDLKEGKREEHNEDQRESIEQASPKEQSEQNIQDKESSTEGEIRPKAQEPKEQSRKQEAVKQEQEKREAEKQEQEAVKPDLQKVQEEELDFSEDFFSDDIFKGRRILLAEDMDINAEIAAAILMGAGFDVERAEDGKICVEMLNEKPAEYYDAVLMDIQMPNLNGYDAARAIRKLEDPLKAEIPIIAMTANAFEEDKRDAFNAGMNGHLGKPIVVNDLMGTLFKILRMDEYDDEDEAGD